MQTGRQTPAVRKPWSGRSQNNRVEVLRRYSNLPDLLTRMQDALRRIEEENQDDEPGVCSTGRGDGLVPVPVRERLGEAGLADLVASFRAGTPKHELATRYGISLSSVKRVLRQRRPSGG